MRNMSLAFRAAANAEETREILVFLVTITHESLDLPKRYSSDPTARLSTDPLKYGTVSRGDTFEYLPMTLQLPDDSSDSAPTMKLVLDNVTREAIPLIRSISTPAQVSVELVLASAPDDVEATWPDFDVVNASYDATTVSLELAINALVNEPYPSGTFTPAGFGGLF